MTKEVYGLLDGYLRWSDGRQYGVGDGVADRDRLAGRVGYLLCHRTACVPGTSASPSSLVMQTTSVLVAKFIFSSLSNG